MTNPRDTNDRLKPSNGAAVPPGDSVPDDSFWVEKAPAFQFYARDWLSDLRLRLLDHEAKGMFVDLLCHQWLEGHLPSDDRSIARLLGISTRKWRATRRRLECHFQLNGDGLMFNPRLSEQRKAVVGRHKERVTAGRKGGLARSSSAEAQLEVQGDFARDSRATDTRVSDEPRLNDDDSASNSDPNGRRNELESGALSRGSERSQVQAELQAELGSSAQAQLKPSSASASSSTPPPLEGGDQVNSEDGHIGNQVIQLWWDLKLPAPRSYNWVLAAAKISKLAADFTDEEILAGVRKIAATPGLSWVKSPEMLVARKENTGRCYLEIVLDWKDEAQEPERVLPYHKKLPLPSQGEVA